MSDEANEAQDLQRAKNELIVRTAFFLDAAAGQGIGFSLDLKGGKEVTVFADELVSQLAVIFDVELTDHVCPFGTGVRNLLNSKPAQVIA